MDIFFVKWYFDNFQKHISLIGESVTNLYWTYTSDSGELTLIITDRKFEIERVKSFQSSDLISLSKLYKVISAPNGDILILGGYRTSSDWKPVIIRLSASGNIVWSKRYDISKNNSTDHIVDLGNGNYAVLINGRGELFTIDNNGNVLKYVAGQFTPFFSNIFVYNQNIYIYGIGDGITGTRSSLFGMARFDFNLNVQEYVEYQFDTFYSPLVSPYFEGHLLGSILVCCREVVISNVPKKYLFKIDLNASFPPSIGTKVINGNTNIKTFESSGNMGYLNLIDFSVSPFLSTICRFDTNLDFTTTVEYTDYTLDLFASSDSLYFNISNVGSSNTFDLERHSILRTDLSFIGDNSCFVFNNATPPSTGTENMLKDATKNFTFLDTVLAFDSPTINAINPSFERVKQVCPQIYDLRESRIFANPNEIDADGVSTSEITVELRDYEGNPVYGRADIVEIIADNGTVGAVVPQTGGIYTATLTSSNTPGTASVYFTVNGEPSQVGVGFVFVDFIGVYDLAVSTIEANPIAIASNGESTSLITVDLRDSQGNILRAGDENVVISTDRGTIGLTQFTEYQGSVGGPPPPRGGYSAVLTSSIFSGIANLSFTVNGEQASATTQVIFESVIPIVTQSPHLYLQAAGSTGATADGSASGLHLRWMLKKDLLNHLPKGTLATTTANYNKPNDYVQLFRAPYTPVPTSLDLSQPPQAIENRNALWLYQINDQTFHLYFRNKTKYSSVRSTVNPLTQTAQFLQDYGNEILELQSPSDLFFAVEIIASSTAATARVETEILSIEDNQAPRDKRITARKTFIGPALAAARLVTENGKSVRFRPTNCQVTSIDLELYGALSEAVENGPGWTALGDFGLSISDTEVSDRLVPGTIDGQWPRYNDEAFVKASNYLDKWNNVPTGSVFSTLKETVNDYVTLSDAADNPTALQTYSFGDSPEGAAPEDNTFELPNLILLQQASMDYHVARMLGLGYLDVSTEVQNSNSFVYLAVYRTAVTKVDGAYISKDTEHRYMTVPTSRNDERLPVPVSLKAPVPGVFLNNGIDPSNQPLTDDQGYTQDGKSRFISLYVDEPEDLSKDRGFYEVATEFNLAEETTAVFAGIEYKLASETSWRRPELPNTDYYLNAVPNGQTEHNETVPLPLPDEGIPIFVHRERENGEHRYGSYGINWFSRSARSAQEWPITTTLQPKNVLLPPSDRSALLVIEEAPLVLTSASEQQLLNDISASDKILVRLIFSYDTEQDLISYQVPATMSDTVALSTDSIFPDNEEVFADNVSIYYRGSMPLTVTGKAFTADDHPTNELLAVVTTGPYLLESTGETSSPDIPSDQQANFIGGVLVLEEVEYLIHSVASGTNGPTFTVFKKAITDKIQDADTPDPAEAYASISLRSDGLFLAVENLQNESSWGSPNPHPLQIQLGDNWPVHRELITVINPDGNPERFVQKTRGIWADALVEIVEQPKTVERNPITGAITITETEHRGQYKATFTGVQLPLHPQHTNADPVEWYRGIVRIHTTGNPQGERRNLEVFKIENIGTANDLVVYFTDNGFSTAAEFDPIQTGAAIEVNFYPAYRTYLYANTGAGITESNILPSTGEGVRYTCFGFRSNHIATGYSSKISVPTVLFAQEVIAPLIPQLPLGALYATRPDSFGKATYTLTTQFDHTPHGVLFYRTDDDAILNALYVPSTVVSIKEQIAASDPAFLANRWQNLLGFDYDYPSNSFQTDGLFGIYPETGDGYRLPNPDNPILFEDGETPGSLNPGTMVEKIREAVQQSFVPMTEIPLLYEHITSDPTYRPIPKKQTVRDRNGAVLAPNDPDFDMAPMAKIVSTNAVQFTDFTLDGTSNNLYFYSSKELSSTMQMSELSPILGPVKLVNTNPPKPPAIRQVVPVLQNTILGIDPQMEVQVNAYPKVENIKKLSLYRALSPSDALSIRSMVLVKEIELETSGLINQNTWTITDDFNDLVEVPFGDPLYYRVTVSREIEYPDKNDASIIRTEYVPSEPSKLVITTIVESTNPTAPQASFTADPINTSFEMNNVTLSWEKSAYKGKYYMYKLNSQGQWVKIHEVISNEQTITVPLDSTDLGSSTLLIEDGQNDNQSVYHQFKIVAENTAGLLSQEETILTIPDNNSYDGIGGMGIEDTFIIR